VAASSAVILPAAARAQSYDRQGAYVGVGFSYGFENFGLGKTEDVVSEAVGTSVKLGADDSPGFDIRGGYRLHPNVAIEGEIQYFTGFDVKIDQVTTGAHVINADQKFGSIDTLAVTMNAKGYVLTGRVQPYGLLGIGLARASFDPDIEGVDSQDDTAFAVRFGAGVDFYATENIVINAEAGYLLPTSDYKFGEGDPGLGGDIIPLTVGVQYRF
jgi:opacity protein-like surface antigen